VHLGKEQTWPAARGTNQPPRHPRTALGFNSRYLLLVEVDGRQKELSMGMSFAELARLMKSLGCTEAMNLDGGGSSTFWLDGKVMNSPSDKHERSLANGIFVVRKQR
jgi:exopolysaccharide biosynthesis protein